MKIEPSVSVTETYSDNLGQLPVDEPSRGWYTTVTPALRVDLNGARAKGFADFRYNVLRYPTEPQLDESQKYLASRFLIEAVERWFFLDARGDITQQNRSPFGSASSPGAPSTNQNRVETTVLQLAPIFRGRISDAAQYAVRYNAATVNTDDPLFVDSKTGDFAARIQSGTPGARFNWIVEGTDLAIRNDVVGKQRDSRVRATLVYEVVPTLQVSASGGYEKTDFGVPEEEGLSSPGAGFTWVPSNRTQVAAFAEKRFFGTGYSVLVNHRTPQSAWRVSSVRDAAVLPTGVVSGGTGSIGGLMTYLLTSAIPDPEEREAAVRQRMEQFGVADSSIISSGVINSRPYVYRNTSASATLQGTRHLVTLVYTDREERYSAAYDSALPPADDIRQRGFTANASRRLSTDTTLSLFASRLRTDGLEAAAPDTRQENYGLAITTRLGRYLQFSVGARRARFESTLPNAGYRENAIFATLSARK